ncbi:MAG: GIY-YIG nuclease family protein [Bacteroidia bacterium]
MTTYIYGLIDPRDNNIKYIGKSNNLKDRLKQHLNEKGNTIKLNWIKHIKKLDLKIEIVELDEVPMNEWRFWENHWVDLFKSWGFKLKNDDTPGAGTSFWNESSKKKSSDRLKGIPKSEEQKRKSSETKLAKSKEEKEAIALMRKKTFDSNPQIEIERRKKLSKTKLGVKNSDFHNTCISEGMKNSDKFKTFIKLRDTKGIKNPKYRGKVFQYSKDRILLIKEWESLKDIQDNFIKGSGDRMGNISGVCNGKANSAYGYFWTRELIN